MASVRPRQELILDNLLLCHQLAILVVLETDGGLGFQGARYEGLTVDFLELLYSNGGSVLSSDGKKATIPEVWRWVRQA